MNDVSRIRRRRALVAVAVIVSAVPSLSAHEFWLEPTTFAATAGQVVGIKVRVGDGGVVGEPVPRDPAILEKFVFDVDRGVHPVAGRDGEDPAGMMRLGGNGLYVIGYLGKPMPVELSADKFDAYLEEEGLTAVRAERAKSGPSASRVRELFTRCAKTLVLAGDATTEQRDRALGFPLELIADGNPYAHERGRELSFQLHYQGRPLAGALVTAFKRRNGDRVSRRSDADGRVSFALTDSGEWLINAVHMVAAPPASNADWLSYWASLTFSLPETSGTPR